MKKALGAVLCGCCSFCEASAEFNISVTTLADYNKKIVLNHGGAIPEVLKSPQHNWQLLFAKVEADLADYLKQCCLMNHGLTTVNVRVLVYQYARDHGANLALPLVGSGIKWVEKTG